MHHSSVPTYVGSNAPSAIAVVQQQQQQHPVMQPSQAPLVRQATYTATSETITDSSLQLLPSRGSPPTIGSTQMLDRNNIPPEFSDQHNKQPLDEYHGGISVPELPQQAAKQSSSKQQKQQQQLNSLNKRQTVSFRRSATADQTEDVKQVHKQQQYKQNCQTNHIYNGDDKGNLDRRDAKLYRQRSAGFTMQQQQLKSGEINLNRPSQQAKVANSNKRISSNDNDTLNEQQLANQYRPVTNTNQCPGSPNLATQSGGGGSGGMNSINTGGPGLAGSGPGSGSGGHIHHQTPVATYPQPLPLTPASIRAAHLLTSNNAFEGISLPAITSHRTNSPWMRISSIILTPIGIVIILFIVVSPLLHYLM